MSYSLKIVVISGVHYFIFYFFLPDDLKNFQACSYYPFSDFIYLDISNLFIILQFINFFSYVSNKFIPKTFSVFLIIWNP